MNCVTIHSKTKANKIICFFRNSMIIKACGILKAHMRAKIRYMHRNF
jgi:hypothetical protein